MVRTMLEALKESPEPKYLVDQATKYLRGLKGSLAQEKRKALERSKNRAEGLSDSSAIQQINPPRNVVRQHNGTTDAILLQQRQAQPSRPASVSWERLSIEDRLRILTSDPTHQT
jgi:hypothetical protein